MTQSNLIRPLLAASLVAILATGAAAQDTAPPAQSLGAESGNFGLAPFQPIPTLTLSEDQKQTARALEDRQLQERRALEDRYAVELRALLITQAQEREELMRKFTSP